MVFNSEIVLIHMPNKNHFYNMKIFSITVWILSVLTLIAWDGSKWSIPTATAVICSTMAAFFMLLKKESEK